MSPKRDMTLPPQIGPDGKDSYPFTLVGGAGRLPISRWYDAVIESNVRGLLTRIKIEGHHPSHAMAPWGSGQACTVCEAAEETDGAIMPCGFEVKGRTILEAAQDERQVAVAALKGGLNA